jgi:predicted secreted hydrolase
VDDGNELSDLFNLAPSAEVEETSEPWTSALSPRGFSFPADHSAHEDYRIEWWYYTGNLETEDGRRFVYQLTFFRTGLHQQPTNPSKWAVRDLYTAHFAVSDISNRQHHCFQKNNRQGIGQAGADTESYHVWNGNWKVGLSGDKHLIQAAESDVAIDLSLVPAKQPVLHGDQGLSRKGPTDGNASHYYSFTRMPTQGQVRIGDKTFSVRGDSWMDHEFSTSFLEPGQLGWDWLSIQLDDGVDLMLYRMRRADGTTDPFSSGSHVNKNGDVRHLAATEYELTPLKPWNSQRTGAAYPLKWRITIPSFDFDLNVAPAFEAQEMTTEETTGISYWEGAIDITGAGPNGSVSGRGYMELTGYAGQGLGTLFDK